MGVMNKVVLVTGASRGIGAATARAFADAGAKVALVARSTSEIDAIAAEIGDNAIAIGCDVADYGQVVSAIEQTTAAFGPLDVLINNAGLLDPIDHLADSDPDVWGKTIDVNLKGVFNGMRAAMPDMINRGAGTIITVSSGAAHGPVEGWSAYCSSKAGAFMLTRCADNEAREKGLRVLGLSPGTVATDMQRDIKASGVNPVSQLEWSDHIPPEWPARTLVWMCSSEADAYLGTDVSLRDEVIRQRVGLV
ncbi:SDR family oxidoreductase [Octadecabacter sp. 1_MG-2023]|uniref:SDR family oxidoreductase n=1 Tax=unclassified Octadecabacter TaxID=196158 RepID=UPI001C089C2F|nr:MULTISPECIES: SDR family oxidoreductase [unclassified Octadecabacter]MBU2992175.1 SDR family oxidoreductase [Octadecabacter sp. B2R22]MDO6735069.1 SDR family oxidoreductase [Octadecabacter sp. 1_MG-2023]